MESKFENMLRGRKSVAMLDHQTAGIREKYDLKSAEVYVIMYLMKNGECNTARDINDSLKLTKGYISKVLDSLCQRELITATVDDNDRRYIHYTLNPSAQVIVDDIIEVGKKIIAGISNGISRDEMELVKSVAIKINDNIDKLLSE